jgi:GTP1/Obg family GTP-binding protein
MLKFKTLKQHLDKLNKKDRFSNEREHLIYTYSIDPLLVNDVISNLTSSYNYFTNDLPEYDELPDFYYEQEMLEWFEEFKEELVYDGFEDFSKIVTLSHFYRLFSPSYNPIF